MKRILLIIAAVLSTSIAARDKDYTTTWYSLYQKVNMYSMFSSEYTELPTTINYTSFNNRPFSISIFHFGHPRINLMLDTDADSTYSSDSILTVRVSAKYKTAGMGVKMIYLKGDATPIYMVVGNGISFVYFYILTIKHV